MQQQIQDAASVLIGKSVWRCTLAADMACFQFGERRAVRSFRDGAERQVGEYALHLQCPWRIVSGDHIVIAALDVYKPQSGQEGNPEFNWDRDGNLLQERAKTFFEDGTRKYAVEQVHAGGAGALRLLLQVGFWLEIYPCDSEEDEYWRLFQPGIEQDHFVVTGLGIGEPKD